MQTALNCIHVYNCIMYYILKIRLYKKALQGFTFLYKCSLFYRFRVSQIEALKSSQTMLSLDETDFASKKAIALFRQTVNYGNLYQYCLTRYSFCSYFTHLYVNARNYKYLKKFLKFSYLRLRLVQCKIQF